MVAASEALELFATLARPADAARASLWLAASLYEQDNTSESVAVLQAVLANVRSGLELDPALMLRMLLAMSANESRAGNHQAALGYLAQVSALADALDPSRR